MPFNVNLFKINLKHNTNSYQLARKLLLHSNMNQTKSNANIISVKNLLEVTDIQSYRDVVNSNNRGVKRLIITPKILIFFLIGVIKIKIQNLIKSGANLISLI